MKFNHMPPLALADLSSVTGDDGRFYTTPEGVSYPSVTTVLSRGTDQTSLNEWRERVGEREARRVSRFASQRGTAVHDMAEKYLLNDAEWSSGHMPVSIASFRKIKHHLDENVTDIIGLELPLYSDKLRVAGRTDLIAKWDGVTSIIDFKTSRREKSEEDIQNYFLQASCYSYMLFERTGIIASNLVILMTIDDGHSKVFTGNAKDHIREFMRVRKSVPL